MSDAKSWIEERRATHAAATPGKAWSNYGTPPFEVYDSTKYADGDMGEVLAETRALKVSHAITDAHNMFPRALDAIERVLELHKPFEWSFGFETIRSCRACAEMGAEQDCARWPCATVQAIEGAINHE